MTPKASGWMARFLHAIQFFLLVFVRAWRVCSMYIYSDVQVVIFRTARAQKKRFVGYTKYHRHRCEL